MKITMTGKYRTRDGQPVRIISIDGPSAEPIIGVVGDDAETSTWRLDGRYYDDAHECHLDLFAVSVAQQAPFGGNWEMHYDWDVDGYPCFYLHGLAGDQKEDRKSLNEALALMAAAPYLFDGCNALLGLLQLIECRCNAELLEIIRTNHRVDEAKSAVALATRSQP